MKKISAAAVFILCLILSACAFSAGARDDIPPYGQSSNGCIYFRDDELIKRLDPEGGRVSVVCPDPVCGHNDESCTAYGKTQLAVCGDTLYFVSNDSAHPASGSILHMYDLAEGDVIFSSGFASAEPGCDYHTDEYTVIRCHHKADEIADEHGNISVQRDHILIVNVKTGDCRMAER